MSIKKEFRIKKEKDFQDVFDLHDSKANKYFVIYKKRNNGRKLPKTGYSVGKKVGKANDRVWVKRRVREIIKNNYQNLDNNYDFIIIARPKTNHKSYEFLKEKLDYVISESGLFKDK